MDNSKFGLLRINEQFDKIHNEKSKEIEIKVGKEGILQVDVQEEEKEFEAQNSRKLSSAALLKDNYLNQ